MDSHVGSNDPGATGISSFISGNVFASPIGILSIARDGGMLGIGGRTRLVAQLAITAMSTMIVANRIPGLRRLLFIYNGSGHAGSNFPFATGSALVFTMTMGVAVDGIAPTAGLEPITGVTPN